jgi:uncharacterized protein YkwD
MLATRPKFLPLLVTIGLFTACLPQPDASTGSKPRRTDNTSGSNSGAQSNRPSGSNDDSFNQGNQSQTGNSNNSSPANQGTPVGSSNNSGGNQPTNPPLSPQISDCYKADAFICKIESLIAAKTNQYRASRGLQALTPNAKMDFVARDWSLKQSNSGRISHTGFPSARNAVYRAEFQQSFSFRGENVAYTSMVGGGDQSDAAAERVAQAFAVMWWNSPGHRANMLGSFGSIGVGVYKNSRGAWYATQLFK